MIRDNRLFLVKTVKDYDCYLFKPTLFRFYFDKRKDDASHRHSLTHLLHMLFYYLRGGYNVLYLAKNDKIVSYISFTRCGNFVLKGSSKNDDFYTIFVWTYPEYRNNGLASLMATIMLNDLGLNYKHFYKTINKNNYSSIAVAKKSGFVMVCESIKVGPFHKIVRVENGDQFLFEYNKTNV